MTDAVVSISFENSINFQNLSTVSDNKSIIAETITQENNFLGIKTRIDILNYQTIVEEEGTDSYHKEALVERGLSEKKEIQEGALASNSYANKIETKNLVSDHITTIGKSMQVSKVDDVALSSGHDDPVDPSATPEPVDGDYAAVESDVADVAKLGSTPPAELVAELVSDGRAPPVSWRSDEFPAGGPVIRETV